MPEFLNRRAGSAFTAGPVVSPVAVWQFNEWAELDGKDALVATLLDAATSAVIDWLGRDLIARDWTLTHWDWPVYGTMTRRSLGQQTGDFRREIILPYGPAISVATVTSYGDPLTEYVLRDDAIIVDGVGRNGLVEFPALVVEYRAGFGDGAVDIPEAIKTAILSLAAFNFEHRGACDATEAMTRSGAASMLAPWRKSELFV